MKKKLVTSIFAIVMLAMGVGCTRIGPGYVGIKINNAGTTKGVQDTPVRTGWVFYMPGQSNVIEYPTFVQNVKWTASKDEGNPINEEISFTSNGNMTFKVDTGLAYHIQPDRAAYFYTRFHIDDLKDFTDGYLHTVARNCYNERGGKFNVDQIMGDNGPFFKTVQDCIQSDLINEGVIIDQFGPLNPPIPPEVVLQSINAATNAKTKAIQIENEVAQTRAEAEKKVAAAEGEAKALLTRAKAEADANNMLNDSLKANVLEKMRLDNQHYAIYQWKGEVPNTTLGGNGSPAGLIMNMNK